MALTFDYKVRDRTGNLVEGQLEGDSLALVVGKLREMGYLPIAVTPKTGVNVHREIYDPGVHQPRQAHRDRGRHPPARHHDRLGPVGRPGPRDPGRPGREQGAGPGSRRGAAWRSSAARRSRRRAPSTPRSSTRCS